MSSPLCDLLDRAPDHEITALSPVSEITIKLQVTPNLAAWLLDQGQRHPSPEKYRHAADDDPRWQDPPVLLSLKAGNLVVRDGAHRLAAIAAGNRSVALTMRVGL
jgi:hypothetical protein